jgi:hypothetical protein
MSWLYPASDLLKVKLARFILEAEQYGMPVRFLKQVVREYDFGIDQDAGSDVTNTTLNGMTLSTSTIMGLQHHSTSMADEVAVNTLYHESTHAYVDLVDADETSMWADSVQEYEGAKLKNGKIVDDPDRVIQEAAAEYVGWRASSVWSVLRMMSLQNTMLDKFEARQITAGQLQRLLDLTQARGTIPEQYNQLMLQRVFGYQMWSGNQSSIADRPIPYRLKRWCDSILDFKIVDRFEQMDALRTQYVQLEARWVASGVSGIQSSR